MSSSTPSDDSKIELLESSNIERRQYSSPGNLTTFNVEYGLMEALLRGMKSGFLKAAEVSY
jgi:hypothetical protein